jgi:outer membrane protein insertion porin family
VPRVTHVLLALGIWLLAGSAKAQVPSSPGISPSGQSPGAGYKVGTVTIKFVGTANVNEQVVRANMQLHEGGDLDDTILDRDIRNLYKTGLFEFVQTKWEPAGPRTYNLVVEVTPKFRVLAVQYVGNKKVKTATLMKQTKTRPNTALDERQVKDDEGKIHDYYQKEGYNQATVTYRIDKDRTTGFGTVIFEIREGNRVRIADLRFTGNVHIKTKALRGQMDTKRWWIFSWLTSSGVFEDDTFDDDLGKLRDFYREAGYLDVDITEDHVVFQYPKPDRLVIVIAINEGRRYYVGQINFSGNKLHSSALLRRVVRQRTGAVFSPSKLDKDKDRLEDFYGKDGYIETRVNMLRTPNLATGNIDVEYQVDEGDKYNVESIEIEGNTKSKSTVILRELVMGPGDVFNELLMKVSKNRLDNTRFFDDVTITPQSTNLPGRENMRVAVKEGRTGALTFGAGYSSLEKATVFAEVSQSNFDLFNSRSLFQGDGQKFRIRVELGQLANEAVIQFEEPYLMQKVLTLGFSLYRTGIDYESTYYDEVDLGATVYIRKHLFELISAQLGYTYQVTEIDNVQSDASPIIQEAAGKNDESRINLELVRDNRDKIINTTQGNYMQFDETVAGGPLGGSNDYLKTEFHGSQFFELFETQAQVISIIARAGSIQTFGKTTTIPFYDAFYLGGPNDLRGFQFRFVSPRDVYGEPIGGKTYGMSTLEYSLDIVSPVRFAIFYDVGFVNPGSYDFSVYNYQDDFGVGLRLTVMGSPLSLDYGIPLRGDLYYPNKSGNQFNFSFGTRF